MFSRHQRFPFLKRFIRIAIAVGLVWVASAEAVFSCPKDLFSTTITVNGHRIVAEVAATPAARRCGLSRRSELAENRGMLFIYPARGILSFWMKDTLIPLSIAFIDDAGRILSIQKMVPFGTEARYRSPGPVRYAIEVNQGWFEAHGVVVGDVVRLELPAGLDIR